MAARSSMNRFIGALCAHWFTAMSGALSVPLGIVAYFVPNSEAKIALGVTAAVCFFLAIYRVWSTERSKVVALEERIGVLEGVHAELELFFDENDPRSVHDEQYWFESDLPRSWHWHIRVRNKSSTKSADELTVRAKDCWFVSCSIAVAHRHRDKPIEKDPIVYRKDTLEPLAVEYIDLFGMDAKTGAVSICVGIDFDAISSVTRLSDHAARSML